MKNIFLLIFVSFCSFLSGQCPAGELEVIISITPDDYPAETTWEITTISGLVIAQGTADGDTLCVEEDECLIFTIFDAFGDGICCSYGDGSYQLFLDGQLEITGSSFGFEESTNFNCPPGASCSTPLAAYAGNTYTANLDNTWYAFFPDSTGSYTISTCAGNTCNTTIWVYDQCAGLIFDNSNQGTIYYAEGGCGAQAEVSINAEAGLIYYIRIGDEGIDCAGIPIQWSIEFDGPISGCMDPEACTFNPLATVNDQAACIYPGDPLCPEGPDLIVLQDVFESSMYIDYISNSDACLIQEGCVTGYGIREVIRFTTQIENIGELDFYIGNPPSDPTQPTTQWEYDNCHNHWHYESYAEYVLFDTASTPLPSGFKNGFCVMDLDCSMNGGTAKYGCNNQGITAQCGDIYHSTLECQWMDITDVPAGQYTMAIKVNWDQSPDLLGNHELSYLNNWAQACIDIERDSVTNAATLTILPDCDAFVDCNGDLYGNAVPDCTGNCGGALLAGDLNLDTTYSSVDLIDYMNYALFGGLPLTGCNDLNIDGDISVTDAALMLDCITHGDNPPADHTHTPCQYPYSITNPVDIAYFQLGDFDLTAGYVLVELRNTTFNALGYQLEIEGVEITSVENLINDYDPTLLFDAGGEVIALSYTEAFIDKTNDFRPTLRVNFSNTTADEICLKNVVAVVNEDYEEVNISLDQTCIPTFVSTRNISSKIKATFTPNPMSEMGYLSLEDLDLSQETQVIIYDIYGKVMKKENLFGESLLQVNRKSWAAGMYYYMVVNGEETLTGSFLIQ